MIRVVYASRAVRVMVMSSQVGISQGLGDTGVDDDIDDVRPDV